MVKFGFKKGHQRYQCKICKRTKSDVPVNPLNNLRVPMDKAVQVVSLLCESMGIRAIERLTGLNRRTVLNILETAGQKATAVIEDKQRCVQAEVVQADELHAIVSCRQQNALPDETERGEQFTFLSVDRKSKLIINWLVGKRTRENAERFMMELKQRMTGRFQLVTDGWWTYAGISGCVSAVFGTGIDYAMETKYFARPYPYAPRQVIGIRRRRRIGNPDMKLASTAHAERTNLSVRLFNRRFTRCTLGYSKKLDNLKSAVALFVWHFNYVRLHSSHENMTPAQAAGITKTRMTVEELLQSTH